MKRILLRCPKDPFEVISPEQTALTDSIGSNTGNLLFLEAAYKLLSTRDTVVDVDRFRAHELGADYINDNYDAYVVPLANGFRSTFMYGLDRLTRVITKLRIPVVLLGGGLQSALPYQSGIERQPDPSVKPFISAILDRSGSVGVRGEYSMDYLQQLGFKDVEVIGCPSMFMWGDRLDVRKHTPVLDPGSRIAVSITSRIPGMAPIVESHTAKYPNLTYIGQEMACLELLLWGEGMKNSPDPSPLPVWPSHPLVRDGKTKMWVDPWPWIDYLRGMDFAFGTRIHGNIAALLAGIPAYVLAHDTRTLELARYFEIPHRLIRETPPDTDAAALYEEADFGPLNTNHRKRYDTFIGYVERHGLRHVFQPGEDPTLFDRKVASIDYPGSPALYSGSLTQRYGRRVRRRTGRTIRGVRRRIPV
jgi:hypothetical protein